MPPELKEELQKKIDSLVLNLIDRNAKDIERNTKEIDRQAREIEHIIDEIRHETRNELKEFRTEVKEEISSIRVDVKAGIASFDEKFTALNEKLSGLMIKAAFGFGLVWFIVQVLTTGINSSISGHLEKKAEKLLSVE